MILLHESKTSVLSFLSGSSVASTCAYPALLFSSTSSLTLFWSLVLSLRCLTGNAKFGIYAQEDALNYSILTTRFIAHSILPLCVTARIMCYNHISATISWLPRAISQVTSYTSWLFWLLFHTLDLFLQVGRLPVTQGFVNSTFVTVACYLLCLVMLLHYKH